MQGIKGRLAALASLAWLATGAAQAREAQRIDIAAQPLASAVLELGRKTGLQVVVDDRLMVGRQSVAVWGVMTPQEALNIMLGESGLQPNVVNDDTLTMGSRAGTVAADGSIVLGTIVISAETPFGAVSGIVAHSSGTGTKTRADLRDVPQAVNVVTADQLHASALEVHLEKPRTFGHDVDMVFGPGVCGLQRRGRMPEAKARPRRSRTSLP